MNCLENLEDCTKTNFGFASILLDNLKKKHNNKVTIILSSSVQATLPGCFGDREYDQFKEAEGEEFFSAVPLRLA